MPTLKGKEITNRAKQLSSVRFQVIREFMDNPNLDVTEVAKHRNLSNSTVRTWVRKAREERKQLEEAGLANPLPLQDETLKDKIIGLLKKGYSRKQLIKEGFAERTIDQAINTYKKLAIKQPLSQLPQFDAIIKTVPDIQTLGLLVLEGFNKALSDKDLVIDDLREELEEITRAKDKIMEEFNEKLAKAKIGTLTLDQIQHRLIRKE